MTVVLSLAGCLLLFLMILDATLTMPFSSLAKNFPEDVQRRLEPRIQNLPMSPKRVIGGILLVVLILAWLGLFIFGGIDGKRNGFTFWQFAVRFLAIGLTVKAFDIVCLDFILLTKTRFFQHFFPETDGCAGWKQFGYNRKQQLRQIAIIIPGSLIFALICSLI